MMPSKWAGTTFEVSAYLTVISLVLVTLATLIDLAGYGFDRRLPGGLAGFWLLFSFAGILVLAQLYLWLGMMCFLFFKDGRSLPEKALWFLLVVLGLSWGATLYFFRIYRKRFIATSSEPARL